MIGLDHDDFGLKSKIINAIDSRSLERDAGGKVVSTFPHPALEHFRAKQIPVRVKKMRQSKKSANAQNRLWLHRQKALALHLLAGELAGAADGLGFLARALLGGLFVMAAKLHLAENALALHLLLERLQGLIDIIVANENLHA
jgi:hypothetical protein